MKIQRKHFIAFILLAFIITRIAIDGTYASEKPGWIVLSYTLFALVISLTLLYKASHQKGTTTIGLMLIIFCVMMASSMYSKVPFYEHLKFTLQLYIPCLFLISLTTTPEPMKHASIIFRKYFAIPCLAFTALATYKFYLSENTSGLSYYQFYQNSPNHVIAQTALKISSILITSNFIWIFLPLLFMLSINVRSAILSHLLSIVMTHRNRVLNKEFIKKSLIIGAPFIAIAIPYTDWQDLYSRLVFRGRDIDSSGLLENASSGRTVIYEYYISYIINNFSITNWLFGVGPIWLEENGPNLSAHNDFLNLITSCGAIGMILLLFVYYQFFKSLSGIGKTIFATTFIVLFATNGVVFHQSNILFSLLYIYHKNEKNNQAGA